MVFLNRSTPVIVDVDLETMSIDPDEVRRAITPETKAIIPVHPFGRPVDLDAIREISETKGIMVIEDAATALGTRYNGRRIGNTGRAVCFSFHPRKLLTTGEGGALVTDSESIWERAFQLRNHGEVRDSERIRFVIPGSNYRMSDIQAAVGLAQFKKFEGLIRERRKQATLYADLIRDEGIDVITPVEESKEHLTYQSYVVRLGRGFRTERDRCIELMRRRYGVETQIGTYSLHLEESFSSAVKVGKLLRGEELFRTTLTLPLYNGLSEGDQRRVVEGLAALSKGSRA